MKVKKCCHCKGCNTKLKDLHPSLKVKGLLLCDACAKEEENEIEFELLEELQKAAQKWFKKILSEHDDPCGRG